MKSLFLTQDFPPALGGIARFYEQLCLHLPPGSVEVCTVTEPAPPGASSPDDRFPVHRMPFDKAHAKLLTSVARWVAWTRRRVAAGSVDVVHAGDLRPSGYVAAWVRARHGVPYVLHVHGHDVWKEAQRASRSVRRRVTARWILGNAACIVANSRATAERTAALLESVGIEAAGRIRVVHPGTDPTVFRPEVPGAAGWRDRLGAAGHPVLLTVARLVARKGVDTVFHALARLEHRAVYVIAGDGPDRGRLEALAERMGLTDRVRFLGAVPDADLPALYAAADLFVMPAREEPASQDVEGFGIVFCEAAGAGLPIIAGRSGGVAEAVREGETAVLVPPGDIEALAAALDELFADEPRRRRMGSAGRAAVESYYNWVRAAAELDDIRAEVVARARRDAETVPARGLP